MKESNIAELNKLKIRKIIIAVIVMLIVLAAGAVIFYRFHISTQARLALREGKNAKLALDMIDIEYRAENKSVYNSREGSGIESGAQKRMNEITQQEGKTIILSYDRESRRILSMTYEKGRYKVWYSYKEGKDSWKVEYVTTVLDYSD